jgi:hypothetical protein
MSGGGVLAQRPAATPVLSFAHANAGNPIAWERMGFCLGEEMRKKCHTLWAEVFCLLDRRTSNERNSQLDRVNEIGPTRLLNLAENQD